MSPEPKQKPLTLDEVTTILSDIARNGEGAERFRALKMVAAQETGSITLPDPISDAEAIERLGRIIRAAGPTVAQLAYRKAFPAAKRPINHAAPRVTVADMIIDRATLPVNLKQLYRRFPEIKRPGVPQGYPMGKGLAVVKDWCQKKALQLLIDQEQGRVDAASIVGQEKNVETSNQPEPAGPAA